MPRWTWAIGLQADRMPGMTETIMFTDSYKHMECLGGMRLQSFLTNGHFVYCLPCLSVYLFHYGRPNRKA